MMHSNKKSQSVWLSVLNSPILWLLFACLPIIIIFFNRVLIPDFSTDVLSYHLFNGMRAAQHPFVPFLSSEFYPVGIANIAPYYDALTYIARQLLGYRLGTVLSLVSAIGCIGITYKLLMLILKEQNKRFHAGWGLLLVNAGIVLELQFQLATYFIDIINAAAVLGVFYLLVRQLLNKKNATHWQWWLILWFAFGVLLALKLTNLPLVIPMAAMLIWDGWRRRVSPWGKSSVILILSMGVIIVPLLPGWIGNYRLSHNPLYPYYNAVFQSPDYANTNFTDRTFGGTTLVAKIFWPIASLSDQLRLGEPHHIYNDYKLILYWSLMVVLIILLLLRWVRLGIANKLILFYFLSSTLLWGLFFGIERYFISSMVLAGLVLAMPFTAHVPLKKYYFTYFILAMGIICCVIAGVEDYRIVRFNLQYDMSWRPSLYQNFTLHKAQKTSIFAHELSLTVAQRQTVQGSDIFLNCNTDVAGLLALLPGASSKPMINIIADGFPQYADMSNNSNYRKERLKRLETLFPGKQTYNWVSIVSDKDIGPTTPGCYSNIAASHGTVASRQPINDFLGYDRIHMIMVSGQITL